MHLVTLGIRPHDFVTARGNKTGSLRFDRHARSRRLSGLVVFQNLEIAIFHTKGKILIPNIAHSAVGSIVNNLGAILIQVIREVIKGAPYSIRKNGSNVHIFDVNVSRLEVTLEPRSARTFGNRITVLPSIYYSLVAVRVTPQALELNVIITLGIRDRVGSLGDSALPGLLLILRHDLTLSGFKLLASIATVFALPLIEETTYLILNVSADHFNARYCNITKAVLEHPHRLGCTKHIPLVIENTTRNPATVFLVGGFLPGALIREHLANLRALLI